MTYNVSSGTLSLYTTTTTANLSPTMCRPLPPTDNIWAVMIVWTIREII